MYITLRAAITKYYKLGEGLMEQINFLRVLEARSVMCGQV